MQLKCATGKENTLNKVHLYTCLSHVGSVSETAVDRVNKPGNYWDLHCMLDTAYSAANFFCLGEKQGMLAYLPFLYILNTAFIVICVETGSLYAVLYEIE